MFYGHFIVIVQQSQSVFEMTSTIIHRSRKITKSNDQIDLKPEVSSQMISSYKQDVTRQRERDLRNENTSLNIFLNFKRERDYSLISKERGIISTQIGKASVDKMNSQDK